MAKITRATKIGLALWYIIQKRVGTSRRCWVHPIWAKRHLSGSYCILLPELKQHPEKFHSYMRMNLSEFNRLLGLVTPWLARRSIRTPINPEERLISVLAFLRALKKDYLQVPSTEEEWIDIADKLFSRWTEPSMENISLSKDLLILEVYTTTTKGRSAQYFSPFVMPTIGVSMLATVITGTKGCWNIRQGDFKKAIENGSLHLPADSPLPFGDRSSLPFFFVGDGAFPLSRRMMKPFPGQRLSHHKQIYNYRISRARRLIENFFGILACSYRVLLKTLETGISNTDHIVKACLALHNFNVSMQHSYNQNEQNLSIPNGMWVEKTQSEQNDNEEEASYIRYRCLWDTCSQSCYDVNALEEHMSQHLTWFANALLQRGNSMEWVCIIRGCGIAVSSEDELGRHLKMHIFHAQKQYNGMVAVHNRFSDLVNCNFPSSSRLSFVDINQYIGHLNKHIDLMDSSHRNEEDLYCCLWEMVRAVDCEMTMKSKTSLRVHVQHHSGDKMCACPFCGVFFANNTKLLDHVARRQEGETEFFCFFCQKNFKTARLLKAHCQRHVRNYKCSLCSIVLDNTFDLRRHVANVHAKIRNHFCTQCDRGFFQRSDLNKHMAVHSNEESFECSTCGQKYRWEKQLRQHEKAHDKDHIVSPYLCHLCGLKYRRGSALSKHFLANHQLDIPDGFSRFSTKNSIAQYELCKESDSTKKSEVGALWYQQAQEAKVLTSEFALKPQLRVDHHGTEKVLGGGLASAIDLDVALRHTEHAGSLLPSTEYAFFRLLMKYEEWDQIFALINDPINYGLFMNEHLSCWAMDQLLSNGNIQGAAKIATVAMQQEMFDFNLLNFMAIYSLLRWNELPSADRIFAANIHMIPEPEEEYNEEEVKTMKFPYLKNEWNDGHFDLLEANMLVGKSIEWFTRSLSEDRQLQAKLGESFKDMCKSLISFGVSLQKSQSIGEQSNDAAEFDAESGKEESAVPQASPETLKEPSLEIPEEPSSEIPTAKMLHKMFSPILAEEEQKLMNFQKKQFSEWNDARYKFIEVQAERLELRLRLDEIAAQQKSLQYEHKVLFFFENRSKYEEEAIAKDNLLQGRDNETKTKEELERDELNDLKKDPKRMPAMSAKDLQLRSKQIGERLSESVHILDHDPSMALYRLQEHINKTMPVLVNRKYQTLQLNSNLQGACFDLDNAIHTIEQMKATTPAFERIHEKLRNCMYYKQQIDYEMNRSNNLSTINDDTTPNISETK
uniref:C2H2-type domain-containing protein n=1 Tax=Ditylenchus dipsaci TaxID=166011 RepID=A0A915EJA4_9BILA